ncbi:peptidylprolyl isomerase, partial [Candidatus Woesearchaeota archaeon]|nr:peptidylprolyl isomerase [Candidatus Woesearchaeota archaeon]MBT5215831.1 peptidylprolyl isomerase [Candidatus Woesearchaeota archaeon]MBT6401922.1 peptidylprolyl isomerase [Candidatus Woesearchaeota archaeon]
MIEKGSKIKLHYTGTLEDGTVFDSSKDKEPLEFEVGAGQVIPGFDEGVIGLKAGEKKTINIPADKAYGQYDEKRMGEYPKENVPKDMELKVGAKMFLQSPDGGVALATIKEIKEEVVLLDLNHPLAGKDLTFEVEIIEVN